MSGDFIIESEDGANKAENENRKRKLDTVLNDSHDPITAKLIKRIMLSLTKPSYGLGLGWKNVRSLNRERLRFLVLQLVRRHNWVEASGVLSLLLKGTCKDDSPMNNRLKYMVSMEMLQQMESDHTNPSRIKNIYDIWIRKIGSVKNFPVEVKSVVHLEFIVFCLTQGHVEEAHQAALSLMQEHEFGSDPLSNMVMGLTFFELWYSTIPNEFQLRDSNEVYSHRQSDILEATLNDPYVERHNALISHEADTPFRCDSDVSVMNNREMNNRDISIDSDNDPHREISREVDVNLQREAIQSFQPQGFYVNSVQDSGDEAAISNHGGHMQYASILCSSEGLDSWLLPLRLPHEKFEDLVNLHKEMLNDYYRNAVKYLRLALYSVPPVLAALLPLIQLLLIGDQVDDALNELENFCCNSNSALPIRLKASLLECFDRNNSAMLSTCFEDILKKDPTCFHALAKLVSMNHNGDYNPESLVEMIALHLDAAYAKDYTWREFASCFLKLSRHEEDQMSACLNGNANRANPSNFISCNSTPKLFTVGESGKAWRVRCRWWLTRHFSKKMLQSEISAGDLQLMTYKAACASHMYGQEFGYVVESYTCLQKENNRDLFLVLQNHIQNSVGFYLNFERR